MTLAEKIDRAKLVTFGNPVNYGGEYHENKIYVAKKSDHAALMPYIKAVRNEHKKKNEELAREVYKLDAKRHDRLYVVDLVHFVIDDDILADPVQIDKFFREKNIIIGQQIVEGVDLSERKDIFGNVITTVDWRFFAHNSFYIDEQEFESRFLIVREVGGNEDLLEDLPTTITVFPRKLKGILRAIYNDDDRHPDYSEAAAYFDSDTQEISRQECIIFVRDLDNVDEIEDVITEWYEEELTSTMLEIDELNVVVIEDERFSKVKISNPISFEMTLQA